MPEVLIIICLAAALFLALRNFPKTDKKAEDLKGNHKKSKENPWQRFFKRSGHLEEIKKEIERGQEKIIAPNEIDLAQKKYMESDPELARLLYEAAKSIGEHNLREAEDLALEALRKDKRCGQAYIIVGKVAALRGGFDDSLEAFKAAIKCNPELGEAYFGLGDINLRDENFTEAIENLQRAVNLSRNEASWHAALGKAYLQVRQFAKAAKALKRATALDMDNKEYRDLASEAEDKMRSHAHVARMR